LQRAIFSAHFNPAAAMRFDLPEVREDRMNPKQWLLNSSLWNRRKAIRRAADGFTVGYWSGPNLKHDSIRDISATGLYLLTQEHWPPGTPIALQLHRGELDCRAGAVPDHEAEIVKMTAHSVRCGRDGVALAFDIPSGIDPLLWTHLFEEARDESQSDNIVGPFKVARALALLSRVCAPQAAAVRQRIRSALTGPRFWNAIAMTLQAETLLTSQANCAGAEPPKLAGSAPVIIKILEEGSWTEDASMSRLWAGLLACACSANGANQASRSFVEILRQLTPMDLRLFSEACTRSAKYLTDDGVVTCRRLSCTADDILRFSGFRDLLRMGRSLERLSEFGLVEERFRTSMFTPVDGINITPTHLGLEFFTQCHGHPGQPESYFEPTPGALLPWPENSSMGAA
jgi:hypothetical protein